jgi:hypothetical protein
MPPMSVDMKSFLADVKNLPGSAVLDLPFCTIGGNSVCEHQCPFFPYSSAGACFRQWHDKDVYGIYESRLVPKQCEVYQKKPYLSWIEAQWQRRCLTPVEWTDFCQYLDQHSELAAVLIYPDTWIGLTEPQCLDQLHSHLGKPLAESSFFGDGSPGGKGSIPLRVWRFPTHCKK